MVETKTLRSIALVPNTNSRFFFKDLSSETELNWMIVRLINDFCSAFDRANYTLFDLCSLDSEAVIAND